MVSGLERPTLGLCLKNTQSRQALPAWSVDNWTWYNRLVAKLCNVDVLGRATWIRVLKKKHEREEKHGSADATRDSCLYIVLSTKRHVTVCMREYQMTVNGPRINTVISVIVHIVRTVQCDKKI